MDNTENPQAYIAQLETAQKRSALIARVNAALSSAVDEQDILSAIAAIAEESDAAVSALAYTETGKAGEVTNAKVVAVQINGQPIAVSDIFPTDDYPIDSNPILGIALENSDEPLFVENIFTDPRTETGVTREAFKHSGMTATIIIWFKTGGHWQGVLTLSWAEEQPFNEEVRAVFQAIQPVAAAVIANRRLMLNLEQLADERSREATLFRKLVENSVDSIFIVDVATDQLTYANQAAHEMFGYDYANQGMFGISAETLWSPEDLSQLRPEILAAIVETGWSGEIRQYHKKGETFDTSTTAFMMLDDDSAESRMCFIVRDITEQKQAEAESKRLQQQVIETQKQALSELSTPIIPIMDQIIVMPLVGGIDTVRSRDIMRTLLDGISRFRAKIAILDITGVPVVDSGVANHLNRTMQAARLKGTQMIITGVSDAVAETMVDLGIDWSAFETLRDLQTGLIVALERLNFTLKSNANGKS